MNEEKEVYFDQYCKSCKYHGLEESKDPCNDCSGLFRHFDEHSSLSTLPFSNIYLHDFSFQKYHS